MKMKENKHCTKETISARVSVRERKKRGLDIAQSDVLKDTHILLFSCFCRFSITFPSVEFVYPQRSQHREFFRDFKIFLMNS